MPEYLHSLIFRHIITLFYCILSFSRPVHVSEPVHPLKCISYKNFLLFQVIAHHKELPLLVFPIDNHQNKFPSNLFPQYPAYYLYPTSPSTFSIVHKALYPYVQ